MGITRIGILSDTHLGAVELWDEVGIAFAGVDLILHSGDISHPVVLDRCEQWAPVLAALGNHDDPCRTDPRVKPRVFLDFEGFRIAMVHDMEPESQPIDVLSERYLQGEKADVFVAGHTHFERLEYRDGVLQVNSGSAVLPHNYSQRLGTVAILELEPGRLRAKIVRIGETEGRRNPGVESAFDSAEVRA